MAFDISGLASRARAIEEIWNKNYYKGILNDLGFHTVEDALPGATYKFRLLDDTTGFSDWCGTPNGQLSATEVSIETAGVALAKDYCEVDLSKLYYDTKSTVENKTMIPKAIIQQQIDHFMRLTEQAIFAGDKSQGSNNKINGIYKQLEDGKTSTIQKSFQAGTTIWADVQEMLKAVTGDMQAMNGGNLALFLNTVDFNALKLELIQISSSFFFDNPDPYKFQLPGFSGVTVYSCEYAPAKKYVLTPQNNIISLRNTNYDSPIKWGEDEYQDKYFTRIKSVIGVAVALLGNVIYATKA